MHTCVYFVYGSVLVLLYFSVVFGNSNGLAVVDYLQKTLLLNMGTSELYSPSEPYQRQPRSPRKARQPSGGEPQSIHSDMLQRSSTNTFNSQINEMQSLLLVCSACALISSNSSVGCFEACKGQKG